VFRSDHELGIVIGKMKISSEQMIEFFEPSIVTMKAGLKAVYLEGGRKATNVVLVGGLSSSPYVYSELLRWGRQVGLRLCRPDGPA